MSNLIYLKGVGPKTLSLLNKLDIYDIDDLVTHYPYKYEVLKRSDILSLNQDDKIIIDGVVENIPVVYRFKSIDKMQFNINIGSNIYKVIIFNRGFMRTNINIGSKVIVIGKFDKKNNTVVAYELLLNENLNNIKIIPFYKTCEGLNKKTIKKLINTALTNYNPIDFIPDYITIKNSFIDKKSALLSIHNPSNIEMVKKSLLRLKYEELFMFMLKINALRENNALYKKGYNRNINKELVYEFINNLSFKLTTDQLNSVNEIINDLNSDSRMNRLLQGDVGSGKTIVALIAIYGMIKSGYQCALMVPTEVLAKQHYNTFVSFLPNVNISLLTGSTIKKSKDEIVKNLASGNIDLVIGTHSLIEDNVTFFNLGLIVTDEQHRFGVNQRNNLKNKGVMPDVLYMSATPIPRTYALTIYGDMDISTIKTMPNGRKPVITILKEEDEIKDVLYLIKDNLDLKHQVYVVAPLIDGENNDSVTKLVRQYKLAFKNYKIGMIHGKLKNKEKEEVMEKFINKEIDILISTTVIEVGVDVLNATMIVIHNANLFGLSTLHQLRGRVGRNSYDNYCVLIGNKNNERLKIMESTCDGFEISESDFKLRGSGDLFGVKQSGDMNFKIADLKKDYKILQRANSDAKEFIKKGYLDKNKVLKLELSRCMDLSDV